MLPRPFSRKRRAALPHREHDFEQATDFCRHCGAHRSSIWLEEWPAACPATANVVGISHVLALRHLAGAPAAYGAPGRRL